MVSRGGFFLFLTIFCFIYRAKPRFDKDFFQNLRQRIKQDRQRRNSNSYKSTPNGVVNAYFAPFSIISFLIGFGILIHAIQWRYVFKSIINKNKSSFYFLNFRIARHSDPTFAVDPRSRSYHAYREWQRLSSLEGAASIPMRDRTRQRDEEK